MVSQKEGPRLKPIILCVNLIKLMAIIVHFFIYRNTNLTGSKTCKANNRVWYQVFDVLKLQKLFYEYYEY